MAARIFKREAKWSLVCCFVGVLCIAIGCVDIQKCEKDRVDQDLTGVNRGYVLGKAPGLPQESSKPKKMTYYNIDVNLPPETGDEGSRQDQELYGNRGYITGGPGQAGQTEKGKPGTDSSVPKVRKGRWGKVKVITSPEQTGLAGIEGNPAVKPAADIPQAGKEADSSGVKVEVSSGAQAAEPVTSYKVKKGDTLERIALKVYGNKKKWYSIYKANQEQLKSPNKIYPGQELIIPQGLK